MSLRDIVVAMLITCCLAFCEEDWTKETSKANQTPSQLLHFMVGTTQADSIGSVSTTKTTHLRSSDWDHIFDQKASCVFSNWCYVTQKRISAPQSEIFWILLRSPKLYLSRDIFCFLGFFVLYICAVYSCIYTIQCKVYYSYTAHCIDTAVPTKHAKPFTNIKISIDDILVCISHFTVRPGWV